MNNRPDCQKNCPQLEMLFRTCVFSLTALLLTPAVAADDWPTYRNDYSRSGVTAESLGDQLTPVWTYQSATPPRPAWQGEAKWDGWNKVYDLKARQIFDRAFHTIIVGNHIYFGSSVDDQVYCLSAETGEVKWRFFTEGPVRLAPSYHDGALYFGSDDGFVYCVSPEDGELIWKKSPGPRDYRIPGNGRVISAWPIRTGLVAQNGKIYGTAGMFPSEGVYLFGLDAKTGEVAWMEKQTDLPAQGYLLASSTRLYVPTGRNNPAICDISNGERLRVVSGEGGTYALLTGDALIFGPGKTGKLGWVEDQDKDQLASFSGNQMIVTPSMSYLLNDTEISALDRTRYLDLARKRRELTSNQSQLYNQLKQLEKKQTEENADANLDNEIKEVREILVQIASALDQLSSQMRQCTPWKTDSDFPFCMILAGDNLYLGGENRVGSMRASDGKMLWTLPVKGDVYGLSAGSGYLLASTHLGAIHCFKSNLPKLDIPDLKLPSQE